MYRIKDAATGGLIEERMAVTLVKQQERVDLPIVCDDLDEADGVIIGEGEYEETRGIVGRGMPDYTPLVTVEETSGEAYLWHSLGRVQAQGQSAVEKLDSQEALQLTGLQGQADQYTVALSTQEQVTSQHQLNLTALQGIADLYATLLTMQAALTPTTTPETEE